MIGDVKMPPRIAALKQDHRGFPIPWNVLVDEHGVAHFKVNDSIKHIRALYDDLCPICGQHLDTPIWFYGGPKSAFHPSGAYLDLPGHIECVEYAMSVCPYLAARNYNFTVPLLERVKPVEGFHDFTQDPNRPPVFVLLASPKIKIFNSNNTVMVRPDRVVEIRYWQKGHRIINEVGDDIVREMGLSPIIPEKII